MIGTTLQAVKVRHLDKAGTYEDIAWELFAMGEDEKDKSKQGFTVIDRRRDGRDGEAASSPEPSEPKDSKAARSAQEAAAAFAGAEAFAQFIMSLATSAYLHLGMLPDPSGAKVEKNLPLAKQTIDILGMLEEKTRGNLSQKEQALMEQILAELRLHYVEVQKKG